MLLRAPVSTFRPIVRVLRILHTLRLPVLDMRLQSLIEISHNHDRCSDRRNQQQDRQHRKCGQRMSRRCILVRLRTIVHTNELENEVRHSGEVEEDDESLAGIGFPSRDVGGEEEESDCDGQGGDRKCEFVGLAVHDDEELDCEAEEEEEVEFEEGDVDLE